MLARQATRTFFGRKAMRVRIIFKFAQEGLVLKRGGQAQGEKKGTDLDRRGGSWGRAGVKQQQTREKKKAIPGEFKKRHRDRAFAYPAEIDPI